MYLLGRDKRELCIVIEMLYFLIGVHAGVHILLIQQTLAASLGNRIPKNKTKQTNKKLFAQVSSDEKMKTV